MLPNYKKRERFAFSFFIRDRFLFVVDESAHDCTIDRTFATN